MRYEDVEPPYGDDPRSLDVFRNEPDPPERPTRSQLDREEHEPLTAWPPNYNDGFAV